MRKCITVSGKVFHRSTSRLQDEWNNVDKQETWRTLMESLHLQMGSNTNVVSVINDNGKFPSPPRGVRTNPEEGGQYICSETTLSGGGNGKGLYSLMQTKNQW